jgi:hypothetical protein
MRCRFLIGLWATLAPQVWAQGSVTVFGAVHDPSGAAVPNVPIILTNQATGVTRRTVSAGDGNYVFTEIPVGSYSLGASAQGFKTFVQNDIRVQVDENRQVNLTLEVGAVTEKVVVTADAAQVETRASGLREVVDSRRMSELPLNGRNPVQLQYLVAGIGGIAPVGQAQNASVSINGSRTASNNYTLDGGDNHDPFFESPSVFPSPDALDEFSIQTSTYSADKGRSGGALMDAVTKSGTNKLHGTLFEFLRNEKFNARNFFSTTVPPFKQNQFGGTVGGPVRHDRTFFFFSYQDTSQRSSPVATTATVLTAAQRSGDFSNLAKAIKDPVSGLPFPGNIIPASRISPPAAKFLQTFIPLPNEAAGMLSFPSSNKLDDHQYVAKIDHQLTANNHLSARLLVDTNDLLEATGAGNMPNFAASTTYATWDIVVNDTHIISPTTLNNVTWAFNHIHKLQTPVVTPNESWTDLGAGFVRTFTGSAPAAYATNVAGYFNASSRFPLDQYRSMYQLSELLSLNRGAHLLKLGGEWRPSQVNRFEEFQGDPSVTFGNTFTTNAAADLLLGLPQQFVQASASQIQPHGAEYALFFQDDWKVSSRLTVNLGMRWEPYIPFADLGGRVAGLIRPGQQSVVFPAAPNGLVFPGDPGVSNAEISNKWGNFGPRAGFAWDPTGHARTSIRGGYGIFYDPFKLQGYTASGPPFAFNTTVNNPPGGLLNPYLSFTNPYPFTPPQTAQQKAAFVFPLPISQATYDNDFRNGISQQWNISVQHQFWQTLVGTIAYVGSKGNHLYTQYEGNPAIYGAPGSTVDQRRANHNFSTINTNASLANSIYHALQLTLNKRLSHSVTLLANYTWSKLIDNAAQDSDKQFDPFNFRAARGVSDFSVGQRFVASSIYDLPKLDHQNRVLRQVAGGWEADAIITMQTGTPFTILSGVDNSASAVNLDHGNVVGDPFLPQNRPTAQRIAKYFNTAAFTVNTPGTFGTVGRNTMIGPGMANADVGLFKNFPVREGHKLQFRAEAFNSLNQVVFGQPGNNVSATNFGKIQSAGSPRVMQFALKYLF